MKGPVDVGGLQSVVGLIYKMVGFSPSAFSPLEVGTEKGQSHRIEQICGVCIAGQSKSIER